MSMYELHSYLFIIDYIDESAKGMCCMGACTRGEYAI